MHRVAGFLFGVTLVLCGYAAAAGAVDIVPYQATDWSYRQVANGDPLEAVFMQPGYDDSAWSLGQAAFGGVSYGCPLESTVHTPWATATDMLLRRWFVADPGMALTLHFAVDNDARIWVNGILVADVVHENCPYLDEWNVPVPAGALVYGANLIAVQAVDRHVTAYFDLRLESDRPVPAATKSWGRIKSLYY